LRQQPLDIHHDHPAHRSHVGRGGQDAGRDQRERLDRRVHERDAERRQHIGGDCADRWDPGERRHLHHRVPVDHR
jgi:hypothetical protein